jgi:hypothetical protein
VPGKFSGSLSLSLCITQLKKEEDEEEKKKGE